MYFCPVQPSDIEVPATASSEDKTFLSHVLYFVKKPEAFHEVRRLVPFADAAFADLCFVDLPVMAAGLLLEEGFHAWCGVRISADAAGVTDVRFAEPCCITPVGSR